MGTITAYRRPRGGKQGGSGGRTAGPTFRPIGILAAAKRLRFAAARPKRAYQWLPIAALFPGSHHGVPIVMPVWRVGGISVAQRMNYTVPTSRRGLRAGPLTMAVKSKQGTGGMSKEQQLDFAAACEGRMSWRHYYAKWGRATLG